MTKINLKELVKETIYSLSPYVRFSIVRMGDKWVVANQSFGYNFPFKLPMSECQKHPNGVMAGGGFDSLKEAERELRRIIKYYLTPFTNSQVMFYFTEDWLEKEEQGKELRQFRSALYEGRWVDAAKIYNQKFSNWTKEAIPCIVTFQLAQRIPKTEAEKL